MWVVEKNGNRLVSVLQLSIKIAQRPECSWFRDRFLGILHRARPLGLSSAGSACHDSGRVYSPASIANTVTASITGEQTYILIYDNVGHLNGTDYLPVF